MVAARPPGGRCRCPSGMWSRCARPGPGCRYRQLPSRSRYGVDAPGGRGSCSAPPCPSAHLSGRSQDHAARASPNRSGGGPMSHSAGCSLRLGLTAQNQTTAACSSDCSNGPRPKWPTGPGRLVQTADGPERARRVPQPRRSPACHGNPIWHGKGRHRGGSRRHGRHRLAGPRCRTAANRRCRMAVRRIRRIGMRLRNVARRALAHQHAFRRHQRHRALRLPAHYPPMCHDRQP
jgi:hypothetical protein